MTLMPRLGRKSLCITVSRTEREHCRFLSGDKEMLWDYWTLWITGLLGNGGYCYHISMLPC